MVRPIPAAEPPDGAAGKEADLDEILDENLVDVRAGSDSHRSALQARRSEEWKNHQAK